MRKGALKWLIVCIVMQYVFAFICKAESSGALRDNWVWFYPLGLHCLVMIFISVWMILKRYFKIVYEKNRYGSMEYQIIYIKSGEL